MFFHWPFAHRSLFWTHHSGRVFFLWVILCVGGEGKERFSLLSKQSLNNLKKIQCRSFLLWTAESFWCGMVLWGSWPRGFAWKDHDRVFRHEPRLASFSDTLRCSPRPPVSLCAVCREVSCKECVMQPVRCQDMLPLMLWPYCDPVVS